MPMGREIFQEILDTVGRVVEQHKWGIFQSAWHDQRLIIFSLDRRGQCTSVTHVTPPGDVTFHPLASGTAVQVPTVLDIGIVGGWNMRIEVPLPRWHEPHPWDVTNLMRVTGEIREIVSAQLGSRHAGDESWIPIHGDMTPWNLRLDQTGAVWLIDWEWASWGPPHADLLRFAATHCSLSMKDPTEIAIWIEKSLEIDPEETAKAASFWVDQRVYREHRGDPPDTSTAIGRERMTGWVEAASLRILAARSD